MVSISLLAVVTWLILIVIILNITFLTAQEKAVAMMSSVAILLVFFTEVRIRGISK